MASEAGFLRSCLRLAQVARSLVPRFARSSQYRPDNRLSRNSTCTIVVITFLKACRSERFCAETRRNLVFFTWERLALAVATASGRYRRK